MVEFSPQRPALIFRHPLDLLAEIVRLAGPCSGGFPIQDGDVPVTLAAERSSGIVRRSFFDGKDTKSA